MRSFFFFLPLVAFSIDAEVNSWECGTFNGASIVASDGTFLGKLGASWMSDSVFNETSTYAQSWSSKGIFNSSSQYGNQYSNNSVFNESASNPPRIVSDDGEEVGRLSIGPSWDNSRFHPSDIKYTCDWD